MGASSPLPRSTDSEANRLCVPARRISEIISTGNSNIRSDPPPEWPRDAGFFAAFLAFLPGVFLVANLGRDGEFWEEGMTMIQSPISSSSKVTSLALLGFLGLKRDSRFRFGFRDCKGLISVDSRPSDSLSSAARFSVWAAKATLLAVLLACE